MLPDRESRRGQPAFGLSHSGNAVVRIFSQSGSSKSSLLTGIFCIVISLYISKDGEDIKGWCCIISGLYRSSVVSSKDMMHLLMSLQLKFITISSYSSSNVYIFIVCPAVLYLCRSNTPATFKDT